MTEKVNKLVDIFNGRSKEKGKYTAYFTPEDGHKIQIEPHHSFKLIDSIIFNK